MRDDAALLREFATQRSEAAFAELVHRHIDAVYSAALRRVGGDTHLAEDVTQHVFTALATKAASLAHHPFLTAWLYTATRHQAANTVRAERRRRAREQEAMEMHESSSAASAEPDWRRIAPVLDQAIDQLGESDRTALLLRFVERQPFADIGTRLQLSEDAARMRVDRALDKLRRALAHRGITSTAAALGLALSSEAVASAPAHLAGGVVASATSAAASASLLTTLLSSMSTAKLTLTAGAALIAFSAGVALYETAARQTLDARLASAQQQHSQLHAELVTASTELRTAEAQLGERENQTAARSGDSVAATRPPSPSTAASIWNPATEGRDFLARHPTVRQAFIDWANARTNYEYSGFYELAGLTPEQIAEFQLLQREHAALTRPIGPDQKEFRLSTDSGLTDAAIDARLRTLLGTDGYQRYEAYRRSRSVREFVGKFAAALTFSPAPLDAQQVQRLIETFTQSDVIPITRTGPRPNWDQINEQARAVLRPEQLGVLDGLRVRDDFNQAYSRLASALMAESAATQP